MLGALRPVVAEFVTSEQFNVHVWFPAIHTVFPMQLHLLKLMFGFATTVLVLAEQLIQQRLSVTDAFQK